MLTSEQGLRLQSVEESPSEILFSKSKDSSGRARCSVCLGCLWCSAELRCALPRTCSVAFAHVDSTLVWKARVPARPAGLRVPGLEGARPAGEGQLRAVRRGWQPGGCSCVKRHTVLGRAVGDCGSLVRPPTDTSRLGDGVEKRWVLTSRDTASYHLPHAPLSPTDPKAIIIQDEDTAHPWD